MPARKLLQKSKNYSFIFLHGVNDASMQRLNVKRHSIEGFRMKSSKFNQLLKEVPNLEDLIRKKLNLCRHFQADLVIYVFYAANRPVLDLLYNFLCLISPAKVMRWLAFDIEYISYPENGQHIEAHYCPAVEYWDISKLHRGLEDFDILYLVPQDQKLIEKLLDKYFSYKQPGYYFRLIELYYVAYHEERDYIKLFQLFMIIESLIVDDEHTGVVYKIRRLCAVLVGDDLTLSETVFQKTGSIYNVRSKLVHSAKSALHEGHYLAFLHSIVCEILLTLMVMEQADDKIFALTTTLGFGVRKELVKDKSLQDFRILGHNWRNIIRSLKTISTGRSKKNIPKPS